MSTETLREALREHGDDLGLWSVFGDELQTSADPRGALVALMIERERRRTEKLLDTERTMLAQLQPSREHAAWRRGFVHDLRIEDLDRLDEVLGDPAMDFVESVVLEVDPTDWAEWIEALAGKPPAWRRVHVKLAEAPGDPLVLAPLLAALPGLVGLQVSAPDGELAGAFDWEGARAPRLEQLVVADAGGGLERADFPVLVDLRVFGAATPALRASALWARLTRRVFETDDELGDGGAAWREIDPDYPDLAMIVVGQAVEPADVQRLATELRDVHELALRVGVLRWHSPQLTVICTYGSGQTTLLPYGLAVVLRRALPDTPIALLDLRNDETRALVLADSPRRPTGDTHETLVRDALDLALGRDPGVAIFEDLLDELAAAPDVIVRGERGTDQLGVLFDIDPDNAPKTEDEDDDDNLTGDALDGGRDPDDDDGDSDWDFEDEPELTLDTPVDPDDEDVLYPKGTCSPDGSLAYGVAEPDDDDALDDDETPDGPDAWLRADATACDRELDPDDERYAERWPDPEIAIEQVPEVDTFQHAASCAHCEYATPSLRACDWCGDLGCRGCSVEDEQSQVICLRCVDECERAADSDDDEATAA